MFRKKIRLAYFLIKIKLKRKITNMKNLDQHFYINFKEDVNLGLTCFRVKSLNKRAHTNFNVHSSIIIKHLFTIRLLVSIQKKTEM